MAGAGVDEHVQGDSRGGRGSAAVGAGHGAAVRSPCGRTSSRSLPARTSRKMREISSRSAPRGPLVTACLKAPFRVMPWPRWDGRVRRAVRCIFLPPDRGRVWCGVTNRLMEDTGHSVAVCHVGRTSTPGGLDAERREVLTLCFQQTLMRGWRRAVAWQWPCTAGGEHGIRRPLHEARGRAPIDTFDTFAAHSMTLMRRGSRTLAAARHTSAGARAQRCLTCGTGLGVLPQGHAATSRPRCPARTCSGCTARGGGHRGADAYAIDGIGSAREVDRLCERDHAYRWLCGGVESTAPRG